MYDRKGYVSLARLWRVFELDFMPLCKFRALACMEANPHSSNFVFGTALDLCEDVFLKSFDTYQLSLVPLHGEVVQIEPVLPHSGARLLTKATAFESANISMSPDEAGEEGKWLKQMGSSAFCAADITWLWPDRKGRDNGEDLKIKLFADAFNTLPILFERPSFTIAQELPPWSNDLLEESYVRGIWPETCGSAICLSASSADAWKNTITEKTVETNLADLIPTTPESFVPEDRSIGGRPQKIADIRTAYQDLGLTDQNLTRKVEQRLLEERLKYPISMSTLGRVRQMLRNEKI